MENMEAQDELSQRRLKLEADRLALEEEELQVKRLKLVPSERFPNGGWVSDKSQLICNCRASRL